MKTLLNPKLAFSLCLLARVAAPADSAKILDPAYQHASPEAYEQWRGLKCFAFTTKHHDGFSLWDTKTRVKQRVDWTAAGGPRVEPCALAVPLLVVAPAAGPAQPSDEPNAGSRSNLARGKPCQVFSSHEEQGWSAAKLTDGETSPLGWSSKAFAAYADHSLYPEFVVVDLETNCVLRRVDGALIS